MDTLNTQIRDKILEFLKTTRFGASSSQISKRIGHNRITVTKYLEVMKAHKLVTFEGVAQAKLWRMSDIKQKPTILVVDDEPHVVELIALSLVQERYRIIRAYSGLEALDKVYSETPDLLILDLMMPGMNGYDVCRKVKENALTQHIPIIILSAKGDIDDKLKGLKTGADDYMTKPFDPMELEARVNAVMRKTSQDLDKHPLTKLPGRRQVRECIHNRMLDNKDFLLIGICFGSDDYRKRLGYRRWENVLLLFSRMLADILKGDEETFVGHTMADSFVIITTRAELGDRIKDSFGQMMPYIMNGSNITKKPALIMECITSDDIKKGKLSIGKIFEMLRL